MAELYQYTVHLVFGTWSDKNVRPTNGRTDIPVCSDILEIKWTMY